MARTIRRFARFGWLIPTWVVVVLVAGDVLAYRQGVPLAEILPGGIVAIESNLAAVAIMLVCRPRLLANAERWEQQARSGGE